MTKFLYLSITCFLLILLIPAAFAEEIVPPTIPQAAKEWFPSNTDSLEIAFSEFVPKALSTFFGEVKSSIGTGIAVFSCVLFFSILQHSVETSITMEMAGAVCISLLLFQNSRTMFLLARDTVTQLTEYEKLFLPVITAATAAHGSVTGATALHVGTAAFIAFLSSVLRGIMFPMIYLFLATAIVHSAMGENVLKPITEQLKKISAWFLKTILMIHFGYLNLTRVITGTADKAAIKVTKAVISTVVPVIGKTLSEASEALMISAQTVKNAVGLYGILVFLALCIEPFLRIGAQYITLKGTLLLCSCVDSKRSTDLIEDYTAALGLLLAMTGTVSVMMVMSVYCYLQLV